MTPQQEHALRTEAIREAIDRYGLGGDLPVRCPYLPHRLARNQMLPAPSLPPGVYHCLMDLNFRRSGQTIYRPACPTCDACRSIRIPVEEFSPSRVQQRCLKRNSDLHVEVAPAHPTHEKHALYGRYLAERHNREMDATWEGFSDFLYVSPVDTRELIIRQGPRILSVGIIDVEPYAVSTVYCYYEPDEPRRSLGTLNILRTIEYAREENIPWVYLGYYIRDCRKMNYKTRFHPCEILMPDGTWSRVAPE